MTRQIVFRLLAKFVVGFYCDSPLAIIQATKVLMQDPNVTDQPLRDHYGERFERVMQHLDMVQYQQLRVKAYYDGLNPKAIMNEDLDSTRFINFSKNIAQLPLVDTLVYEAFYVLFNSTTLRDMSIPAEAFAEENRKYKSFEIEEEERRLVEKRDKEDLNDDDD